MLVLRTPMQLITMKKPSQIFLIIVLACASQLCAEENLPPPFEAFYTIFKKGAEVAKMHRSLSQLDNGEYIYRSETNSTGLVSIFYKLHILEESHWHLKNQKIQPLDYSYQRIKKKKKSHKETIFDWENHQVNSIVNGRKSTLELKPEMTDKLLYQLDIMHNLEIGHQPASYTVIDGTKIKTYNFEYLGEEFLETPIGRLNTVKIIRQKPGDKGNLTLWCAGELHFLPVMVETTDDEGSLTTAMITKLVGITLPDGNYSSTNHSE